MRKPALSALLLGCLLAAPAPAPAQAPAKDPALQELTVQPGDTLWGLSQRYLKDPTRWNEILRYNRLPTDDPTVALPGMRLKVPVILVKEAFRSARVTLVVNDVAYRRRETPSWHAANIDVEVLPGDTLRTMRLSQAKVRFATGEGLHLQENSMVVLAPPKVDADAQILKGHAVAQRSRLMTATAMIRPKTRDADYSARVMEDLRTVVQVYRGTAEVEAQGKAVDVPAGFASEVPVNEPPSLPREFPKLPEFAKEKGDAGPKVSVDDGILKLALAGLGGGGGPQVVTGAQYVGYRVQVARDAAFEQIVLDRRLRLTQQADLGSELADGRYWWRISLEDAFGFESAFTQPLVFERKRALPVVKIASPAEGEVLTGPDSGQLVEVRGETEPGAAVEVEGQPVPLDANGRFTWQVFVKPGIRRVKVTAFNRWGRAEEYRQFRYDVKMAVAAQKEEAKPVLPEKRIEERIIKPLVIPTIAVAIALAVLLAL